MILVNLLTHHSPLSSQVWLFLPNPMLSVFSPKIEPPALFQIRLLLLSNMRSINTGGMTSIYSIQSSSRVQSRPWGVVPSVRSNLPNTNTSLGREMFWDCSSLLSIDLPNAIIFISPFMFRGCSSLTSITIPPSVTQIWPGCFWDLSFVEIDHHPRRRSQ